MSRLQSALKKKGATAKQSEPKATKSKTHEEVVAKNGKVDKAITNFHKANEAEANALIMKEEAIKTITDFGISRMHERKNTQNITMNGSQGDVYIALKDQYTLKVNADSSKCDELEEFLTGHDVDPSTIVKYEEKASFNIGKMTDKEVDKLSTLLAKAFGQERMDEILAFKTVPVIKGLVDILPAICDTKEDWGKVASLAKQHRPTINVPSKKGKK